MAKYERIVTTGAGLELLENAAYMGGSIQFTSLKTGNGVYDGTEDLASATGLKNVCQTFGIGSVSKRDGIVVVRVVIDNKDLADGYTMTELGLYATNPDTGEEMLYSIVVSENGYEDYVPPYADAPASITFEAFIELTESTEPVTFTIASMEGVYTPAESFKEHTENEDVHVTAKEKENWNNKQGALTIDEELDEESENPVKNKAIAAELSKKLSSTGNASNTTVAFSEASELTAPVSESKISVLFGVLAKAVSSLISHLANKSNPHSVTKTNVGLGNVPNVATNDQTPTYTAASANANLTSGEKLSVAFGKIAKAISSLISHLADTVSHVTSAERTAWNAKANGTHTHTKSQITDFPTSMTPTAHTHTKSQITDFPSTMTPSAHNQSANTITAGTLAGQVKANASAVKTLGTAQVRDIYVGTTDMTAGTSTLTAGVIYGFYET